jgi:xylan 1,4-beta-xylosidase
MVSPDFSLLDRQTVHVDAGAARGPVELWRQTLGVGGINTSPLPPAVVAGAGALRPRLIRIFIQQFFDIYPEHGRFDWSRLDPYMDSLATTGAKVVAAICIKPGPLFERIDQGVWKPNDVGEWQDVITALVRRYSVERDLVTYWEIGNETDIGEDGGSPYLIPDPADYAAYYDLTAPAVRAAAPHVKVGGTAACWVTNEPLPGFVEHCRTHEIPLDFISWHIYNNDWERHAEGVREGKRLLTGFPEPRPEMMVTEWSTSFEAVSVADQAYDPRRAALVAASILAMDEAGLDWSFYYHLWDQVCDRREFEPFFSPEGVDHMVQHWNEGPHRFGLFGERGEVRPQYFVYQLTGMLGDTRVAHEVSCADLHAYAATGPGSVSALVANTSLDRAACNDRVVTLQYSGLTPGPRLLTVYRIDDERRWCADTLAQEPLEERVVVTGDRFEHQVYLPAHTVAFAALSERDGIR